MTLTPAGASLGPLEIPSATGLFAERAPRRPLTDCKLEPNWQTPAALAWPDNIPRVQFERLGYSGLDPDTTGVSDSRPIFNRTAMLRDTWAKVVKKGGH